MSHHLVSQMISDARASGATRWLRANCLACPERAGKTDTKRSFAFHTVTGFYKCLRCGLRGRAEELASGLSIEVLSEVNRLAEDGAREATELPRGFYLLDEEPARSSRTAQAARAFLDARGITEDKRRQHGIGAVLTRHSCEFCKGGSCRFFGRVIVPIRDLTGKLMGYVGRSWAKKSNKPYAYPMGFRKHEIYYNHEALLKITDVPLLVVEGVFDCMSLGEDAVACLGMPGADQLDMLMEISTRPIVFVLDGDAWLRGWAYAQQLTAACYARGLPARFASLKLPGGCDPDELSKMELVAAAREAIDFAHPRA